MTKRVLFIFLLCLFFSLNPCTQSKSENFKLFTDVLDGIGGRAESQNFLLRIGSGGQPGVVGIVRDSSSQALQGYLHSATFICGDANGDSHISLPDVVWEINYILRGGPPPRPPQAGDVNCNNIDDIVDVVYKINYLFRGGPAPCCL
jgi:hypothetical protein